MLLADYIITKPTIHTERLIIRPMNANDVTALKDWMPDSSIYTYWGKGPSKSEKNPELLFEKSEKPTKTFHLGIEEISSKANSRYIDDGEVISFWCESTKQNIYIRDPRQWKYKFEKSLFNLNVTYS